LAQFEIHIPNLRRGRSFLFIYLWGVLSL
jgi:hypothetical protein